MQKILDAAEGCTGGGKDPDRQTEPYLGQVQSRKGRGWQARCTL